MAKKQFQAEQIIGKLREAEVEISKGPTVAQIAKKLGIHQADVLPLAWIADRPGQGVVSKDVNQPQSSF